MFGEETFDPLQVFSPDLETLFRQAGDVGGNHRDAAALSHRARVRRERCAVASELSGEQDPALSVDAAAEQRVAGAGRDDQRLDGESAVGDRLRAARARLAGALGRTIIRAPIQNELSALLVASRAVVTRVS